MVSQKCAESVRLLATEPGLEQELKELRADDFDDLFLKQLGEYTEPDADAQGEQPFLRRADQLAERLLPARSPSFTYERIGRTRSSE